MNYAVYMKNETGTPHNTMIGLFLMREDAEVFFKERDYSGGDYSYHLVEVDSWEEWVKIKKLLP